MAVLGTMLMKSVHGLCAQGVEVTFLLNYQRELQDLATRIEKGLRSRLQVRVWHVPPPDCTLYAAAGCIHGHTLTSAGRTRELASHEHSTGLNCTRVSVCLFHAGRAGTKAHGRVLSLHEPTHRIRAGLGSTHASHGCHCGTGMPFITYVAVRHHAFAYP